MADDLIIDSLFFPYHTLGFFFEPMHHIALLSIGLP
jgi:hypothetical protein